MIAISTEAMDRLIVIAQWRDPRIYISVVGTRNYTSGENTHRAYLRCIPPGWTHPPKIASCPNITAPASPAP